MHHLTVATPHFDEAVAAQAQRGEELMLSGTFSGIRVAFLPTDRELDMTLEIFDGLPGAKREQDATSS